ncbi:alpha-ketoglutarate-dependent dioxygenase AlkB [Tunturiibacter psychrotolerans]|uniref:alpha-ketoglutarate-dependent dioxygenase AlkB n=1 Tax=Tunturiibacter psychrotolerans TaxID=3069686 RepID=UPI003D20AE92
MTSERALFPEPVDKQRGLLPEGFRYEEDIISEADEAALAKSLATLDLKQFEFHGHLGNRRVISFGLRYDYARRAAKATDGFPAFVADVRNKVAKFAGRKVDEFQQGGVNQYPPGAGIGWHKDKPQFGVIVGVSLLAPATMRFRRAGGTGWIRTSQRLEPRSIYILEGEARTVWEHSVPPVDAVRYSLTFRTVAEGLRVEIEKLSLEKLG